MSLGYVQFSHMICSQHHLPSGITLISQTAGAENIPHHLCSLYSGTSDQICSSGLTIPVSTAWLNQSKLQGVV